MKLFEVTTDRIVRLLSVLGIVAAVAVIIGWNTVVVPHEEDEPIERALYQQTGVQQAVLYGAMIGPLGDQDVRGYAVILPTEDGGAEIVVDAHGVESSVQHMQHIHSGMNCSNIGGVLQPLEPYPDANEAGAVHYREMFDTIPDDAGDRVVVIHGADGAPVACGELEAFKE